MKLRSAKSPVVNRNAKARNDATLMTEHSRTNKTRLDCLFVKSAVQYTGSVRTAVSCVFLQKKNDNPDAYCTIPI